MSRARDKANSTVSNFASTGIDDNADATAITIDSSERVGIATPATSNARCLLHTHPSGTGSIPTNYLVQQDDNNLGLVIMNTNDSATYSGLRIETRSTQAAGWLVANEFQSAFNGDLVFRARNAGSTSAEIARNASVYLAAAASPSTATRRRQMRWMIMRRVLGCQQFMVQLLLAVTLTPQLETHRMQTIPR